MSGATPGQTVGPFFGYALPYDAGPELVAPDTEGAIRLRGRVLDGAGDPVPDALLELWQTDPLGHVLHRPGSLRRDGSFTGWGRAETDAEGRYAFTTLRPGAAFFSLTVFARGLLDRLFTRVYLPGTDLAEDPLLAGLGDRAGTLLAAAEGADLRFDVRLQGEGETVFLRYPRH